MFNAAYPPSVHHCGGVPKSIANSKNWMNSGKKDFISAFFLSKCVQNIFFQKTYFLFEHICNADACLFRGKNIFHQFFVQHGLKIRLFSSGRGGICDRKPIAIWFTNRPLPWGTTNKGDWRTTRPHRVGCRSKPRLQVTYRCWLKFKTFIYAIEQIEPI